MEQLKDVEKSNRPLPIKAVKQDPQEHFLSVFYSNWTDLCKQLTYL